MKGFSLINKLRRMHQEAAYKKQFSPLLLGLIAFNPFNYLPERYVTLSSPAMVPTIFKNQAFLFVTGHSRWGKIDRGVVIWYKTSKSQGSSLVSRVVGLPGDVVEVKRGLVYINGLSVDDPETTKTLRAADCIDEKLILNNLALWTKDGQRNKAKITVPDGEFYAISDNRATWLMDSRFLGPIKLDEIKGVAHLKPQNRKLIHDDCMFD